MTELKDPIAEAKRYIQNAKTTLKNDAHKQDNIYLDEKYVRSAGHFGWHACLIALEAVYKVKETKKKGTRVSVDDYKDVIAKRDPKFWKEVLASYEVLHLYMGYDGNRNYLLCQGGITGAERIVEFCSKKIKCIISPKDNKSTEG